MTQAERDRLVALKKANKKLITQKQAAEEIGVTERQVRRLLRKLRRKGDRAVMHELRGRASNRKLPAEMEQRAITILSDPVYRGFGPTLAAEHLSRRGIAQIGRETAREWMLEAGLWRAGPKKLKEVHTWRERRECFGELVPTRPPRNLPTQLGRRWTFRTLSIRPVGVRCGFEMKRGV